MDIISREKEELGKEKQQLAKQLEEFKQGSPPTPTQKKKLFSARCTRFVLSVVEMSFRSLIILIREEVNQ